MAQVLCPPNNGKFPEIFALYEYHPYRMPDKTVNPDFRKDPDGVILDLKEGDGKLSAITRFVREINPLVCEGISIAVVPSHSSTRLKSGIRSVAENLARKNNRIDCTKCLIRHTTIDKLADGGERSIEVHLESIKVVDKHLVKGASILLLDDVTTSGNSLRACKQLLRAAGATCVKMFAVGRTTRQ